MRLISYLLYGLSSTILKKNTIKPPEVIFHICLRALWLSSSLIRKQYLYASFLSVIENLVVFCPSFCCFRPRAHSFFSQLKRAVEPRKIFIMHAQQPIRAHVLLQLYNKYLYCEEKILIGHTRGVQEQNMAINSHSVDLFAL